MGDEVHRKSMRFIDAPVYARARDGSRRRMTCDERCAFGRGCMRVMARAAPASRRRRDHRASTRRPRPTPSPPTKSRPRCARASSRVQRRDAHRRRVVSRRERRSIRFIGASVSTDEPRDLDDDRRRGLRAAARACDGHRARDRASAAATRPARCTAASSSPSRSARAASRAWSTPIAIPTCPCAAPSSTSRSTCATPSYSDMSDSAQAEHRHGLGLRFLARSISMQLARDRYNYRLAVEPASLPVDGEGARVPGRGAQRCVALEDQIRRGLLRRAPPASSRRRCSPTRKSSSNSPSNRRSTSGAA